jgi:hypothetical protein
MAQRRCPGPQRSLNGAAVRGTCGVLVPVEAEWNVDHGRVRAEEELPLQPQRELVVEEPLPPVHRYVQDPDAPRHEHLTVGRRLAVASRGTDELMEELPVNVLTLQKLDRDAARKEL